VATSSITALIVGLALGLLGLALVRQSWLRRQTRHTGLMATGWSLMILATAPLVVALGPDLGVTTAFMAPMLGAIALLSPGMTQPVGAASNAVSPASASGTHWLASLRTLIVCLLAGPAALTVTLIASIALLRMTQGIGWTMPDSLLLVFLFAPLAWAGLAVISALDAPLRWRSASLAALAAVFAILAFLLPPSIS
jgi:hypothetical protein